MREHQEERWPVRIKNVEDVLEVLDRLSTCDIKYELRKLRAIRDHALRNLGVDYRVGDTVVILSDLGIERSSGWWPSRECLAVGATAQVRDIDFNAAHGYWYADVVLDREWSCADRPEQPDGVMRFWCGPVQDTPEGYKPPSPYDQEHYPQGRKHTFAIGVGRLGKAPLSDSSVEGPNHG